LAGVCWLNYGLACHLSGAVEEARSAYGRAIRAAGRAVEGLDAKMFGALAMLEMGQRDQAIQWLADVRGALGRGKYPVRDAMLDLCDQRLSGVIHSELAEPHLAEHLQYSQDLRFARRLVTM